uniref:Uncharacterized protein n=1 Tax=Acrobeloides nanus TaxID=290746 RepID=A0A914DSS1_9BILA
MVMLLKYIWYMVFAILILGIQYSIEINIEGDHELTTFLRPRRNMLIFSKFHRSVWPYHQGWPKRFVEMGPDPEFDMN